MWLLALYNHRAQADFQASSHHQNCRTEEALLKADPHGSHPPSPFLKISHEGGMAPFTLILFRRLVPCSSRPASLLPLLPLALARPAGAAENTPASFSMGQPFHYMRTAMITSPLVAFFACLDPANRLAGC